MLVPLARARVRASVIEHERVGGGETAPCGIEVFTGETRFLFFEGAGHEKYVLIDDVELVQNRKVRVRDVGDEKLFFRLGERVESVRFPDTVDALALEVFDDAGEKAHATVFYYAARRRDRLERSGSERGGGRLGDGAPERVI